MPTRRKRATQISRYELCVAQYVKKKNNEFTVYVVGRVIGDNAGGECFVLVVAMYAVVVLEKPETNIENLTNRLLDC